MNELINKFKNQIHENYDLSKLTTIGIGGFCKYYIEICSLQQLKWLTDFCTRNRNVKFKLIGQGSNLVFSDNGFNGIIARLAGKMTSISRTSKSLICYAGAPLMKFNLFCRKQGYSGFEWSFGIPGSVGGAVFMNAGAFGGEMSEFVKKVYCIDRRGQIKIFNRKECGFAYRKSIFQTNDCLIYKVEFAKIKGSIESIEKRQMEILSKRHYAQPHGRSAGSVFKKHDDIAISKIIDELGLKGFCVGDAEISKKHAGFIINNGSATCKDFYNLVEYIQKQVQKRLGFKPELEVEIVEEANK